jgi:hypothetical protein
MLMGKRLMEGEFALMLREVALCKAGSLDDLEVALVV